MRYLSVASLDRLPGIGARRNLRANICSADVVASQGDVSGQRGEARP